MLFSVVQLDDRILLRYGKWSTCSRWVSPIKMLKTGRGVFVAAGKYLSLFDVYGEVKMTVSIAELVDRLLQVISRIAGSSIVICILELCDGSGTSMFMCWSFEVLKMTLARQNWMSMPGLSGREYHRAKQLLGTGRRV